ncbi:MAG: pantetheine-phosphate adenylyltransferase [Candidatus Marinimicrobia bacterium]|nr:pantetheine-phosphate adenylyltransferase [Candidatus Neomarinimicrobiota bacterium]MCF7851018.1 pantetheine-phosphate adenylyltransferase [Candidatus Neomarinimicrobiota bacterium]
MKNSLAIYPGTFDPITLGHLDIIERAVSIFDEVVVSVGQNIGKQPLFTVDERIDMIKKTTAHMDNVRISYFDGLIVDYARKIGAKAMIRGLRAMSDFEFEFQMALVNRTLYPELVQVFLMPHEAYTHLNSTIVREVSSFGGDITSFVTPHVAEVLHAKFHKE